MEGECYINIKTLIYENSEVKEVNVEAYIESGKDEILLKGTDNCEQIIRYSVNAIKNVELKIPKGRICINVNPAISAEGQTSLFLAVTAGILFSGLQTNIFEDRYMIGELLPAGKIKEYRYNDIVLEYGIKRGISKYIMPCGNGTLYDIIHIKTLRELYEKAECRKNPGLSRITEIALSGMHNTFMTGSESCGIEETVRQLPELIKNDDMCILYIKDIHRVDRRKTEILKRYIESGIPEMGDAKLLVFAQAKPCICGEMFELSGKCKCNEMQKRFCMSKLPKSIISGMDIQISVKTNRKQYQETAADIAQRIKRTRQIQEIRYKKTNTKANGMLTRNNIERYCKTDKEAREIYLYYTKKYKLNMTSSGKILRVARTIADISDYEIIKKENIAEALQYRWFDTYRERWDINA